MANSLFHSFRFAWRGVLETIARERNMRVHLVAAVAVGLFGSEVELTLAARLALAACVFVVPAAEVLNTALEALVDLHTREIREEARRVKDAAAGAVLVLAGGAVCVAALVAWASLAAALDAARHLGPLALTDLGVVALTAALATGAALPRPMLIAMSALGAVLLGFVLFRSVSPPLTVVAALAFLGISSAPRAAAAATSRSVSLSRREG